VPAGNWSLVIRLTKLFLGAFLFGKWVSIGNNPPVSTTTAPAQNRLNRPNMVAVGTIVWLSSELMFFAALFAMYFTTRAVQGPKIWLESTGMLNVKLLQSTQLFWFCHQ